MCPESSASEVWFVQIMFEFILSALGYGIDISSEVLGGFLRKYLGVFSVCCGFMKSLGGESK